MQCNSYLYFMKKCFKCNKEKPLTDYYKHSGMSDGHLNKCKECTRLDTKKRLEDLCIKDPNFKISERKRHRDKYYRLGYKDKHKPNSKDKKIHMDNYHKKYPEKYRAKVKSSKMKSIKGNLHHWSYKKEHYTDVIDINPKDHMKAHRFLIYDQERMMYRKLNGVLLDTKEKHLEYINYCIKNEDD